MRRHYLVLILIMVGSLAGGTAFLIARDRHRRTELGLAKRELGNQQLKQAKDRLSQLARRWPDRGDVEYWLGTCELAAGNPEAALEAWSRVPATAPEANLAALACGRLAMDQFRFSLAEPYLEQAARDRGETANEAAWLLGRLHWLIGRHEEYRRFLRREVEKSRNPWENLRLLWSIDHDGYPVEGVRREIDQAKQAAPNDDRVWLALADLAMRTGRLSEADDYLRRCEEARPNDLAVWQARLEWGRSAGRTDEVIRAARHLPGGSVSRANLLSLRASLAAERGDRAAERAALESLIELETGNTQAIERLTTLAALDGQNKRAAELRQRKAGVDAATERYRALIVKPDLASQMPELAKSAEQIGRRFDARAWWNLAMRRDSSIVPEATAALARLAQSDTSPVHVSGTLADLLDPGELTAKAKSTHARPPAAPAFADEAETRGIRVTFENGRSPEAQLPETMSGGVALLDFDGDGWLDIYAIQGGKFPPPSGRAPFGDRLFRNRGNGRFEDVTGSAGLSQFPGGYGHGVAVGDYDNDGRPDLFVTRWRSYALYHNLGNGHFEDATAKTGLNGDRDWPTSAAWADLDNDGDLDLYVCHYLQWDAEKPTLCPARGRSGNVYCDPRFFPSLPDHVFRNDGGRFVDVTEKAGFIEREGRGLGVVTADFDGDGRIDIFVANDTTANYFFHNEGNLRFVEKGQEAGVAASNSGGYQAGMGVACADFDGDGLIDLAVTNFYAESTSLYQNLGHGLFTDRTTPAGLTAATRFVLGFGLTAIDANNDGAFDLAQANGHVADYRPAVPYAMPAQLLLNDGAGRFTDVSDQAGPPWRIPQLARGLAAGDLDNDGRTDLVMVTENAPLVLFHNQTPPQNHFLTLELEGSRGNRDAIGATVSVAAAGRTRVAVRSGGGSYLSSSDHRLHFGLGSAKLVDHIEVAWPSGRREVFDGIVSDRGYHLREGNPSVAPLPGFANAPKRP